jgi:hypothetical protein
MIKDSRVENWINTVKECEPTRNRLEFKPKLGLESLIDLIDLNPKY